MAGIYYKGNALDTTSKAELGHELVLKVTEELMRAKKFTDRFSIFDRGALAAGAQIEEIEVGNLTPVDFDPTGTGVLDKKALNLKAIYHKINREKTLETTTSDKQIKQGLINEAGVAGVANIIVNELYNSDAIANYDAFMQLLKDICNTQKNMVVADLNGNGTKIDAVVKAIQTVGLKMTFPSTNYNFLGFKKEFCDFSDLVLIVDASFKSILDVDSLAAAFNMDKKALLSNIIVIDEMPDISYVSGSSGKCTKVADVNIGETKPVTINKLSSSGEANVEGKAKFFIVSKEAIIRTRDRDTEMVRNVKGRFNNYYLHCEDMLSYSPLRNAVVFVD